MKKCVMISDSFKGSLSSSDICAIARESVEKFFPGCEVVTLPVADGGEGTVDCFLEACGGEAVKVSGVSGPYGEKIDAVYARLDETTAVVEMAATAGLPMVGDKKDPCRTTTYGVGELVRHAVEQAYCSLGHDQEAGVSVKTKGGIRIIYIPSLLYAESHGRCLQVVSTQEKVETYEKLGDFAQELDRRFVICHKSFLVNMDHVRQYCGTHFIMDNGAEIPISQTKRKTVREQFTRYMGGLP